MDAMEFLTGKPWDPDADEEYQAILRQVRTNPPSCLKGFKCTPAHPPKWDDRTRWKIACACGSSKGALLGYPLRQLAPDNPCGGMFVSPLAFRCASCEKVTELFDTKLHGYDAEISKSDPNFRGTAYRGEGPRTAYACKKCRTTEASFVCEFGHSHFDVIFDEPELFPVAQNYYDGFGCHLTCASCGHEVYATGFELA